ncbi:MAG: ATP-binding cassette domain-containing protein [Nevskiaceae bacterium]|nr:ATP-binding cassette domain-containing protein [Nevskiaceae bacterium]
MDIELNDLQLERGGRRILTNICWHLTAGQHWLVAGGNGAGKTQLLKVLAGDVWPTPMPASSSKPDALPARRYRVGGQWFNEPAEAKDAIAYVGPERQDRYQRYGWDYLAWEVVATGLYRTDIPLQRYGVTQRRRADALLKRAGIAALSARRFLSLSFGERRLVLLARALATRPQVLLLDELLTGLDGANRERARGLLAGLRSTRLLRVSTAHRIEDLPPGVDHLLRLEGGRIVYSGRATAKAIATALESGARATRDGVRRKRAVERAALVTFRNVDIYMDEKPVLRDINFTLRRGECWVVHGVNGSGKSTLLRAVYGDHHAAFGGEILRAGIGAGVPVSVFKERTGFVAPQLQADYPRYLTVLDTVVSGLHASYGLNEPATAAELRRARRVLKRHQLTEFEQRTLGELSYGQVRRVLFARAAVTAAKLMLLDEPYTGLSGAARTAFQQALEQEIDAGITVMIATHYDSEWPRHATHEIELRRGRVRYAGVIR